ncbi:MAG: CHASE sensor domain-containing protein [Sedimentisphaerales bacterium]
MIHPESPAEKRDLKQNDYLVSRKCMVDSSRRKFITITFAAGMSMGLLFASLSFINSQRKDSQKTLMYFTSTQAKLISTNVKCAMSFSDAKDANAILETLKIQNCIAFAGIYDCNGKLFSSYYRDDVRNREFKLVPPTKAKFISRDGFIVVSEPIIHQRQFLGTVCLWTQL